MEESAVLKAIQDLRSEMNGNFTDLRKTMSRIDKEHAVTERDVEAQSERIDALEKLGKKLMYGMFSLAVGTGSGVTLIELFTK